MSSTVRLILIIAAGIVIGIVLLRLLSGCASTSQGNTTHEAQLHNALDILADTVDPASQLAKEACVAREQAEVDAVKKGQSTTTKAEEALKVVRARCDVLKTTFDRIRITQADAVKLVHEGATEKAQERLEELRQLWQSINMLRSEP